MVVFDPKRNGYLNGSLFVGVDIDIDVDIDVDMDIDVDVLFMISGSGVLLLCSVFIISAFNRSLRYLYPLKSTYSYIFNFLLMVIR